MHQKDFVYGPYLSNGSYKIAKLVDSRVGPDSVKARHILLDINQGGIQKALAKADSLKKLIEGGKSFEELAKMYSIDKNSGAKGGDLGTFGRGAMIPVFEDAVFNGKKGELKIVTSQYGVHLIQIEDQKGSSQVVKVAVVDKPISASPNTQTAAYSKAQAFLANLNKSNFDAEAKKAGLSRKTANDVNALSSSAPGLDNAREVVRWAFKAQKGDFADQVYVLGDQYIIPVLTEIKPKGLLPLDVVRKQIEPAVRNHVKAKLLMDKFATRDLLLIRWRKKRVLRWFLFRTLYLQTRSFLAIAVEYKVVGAIFGSQPNKLSKPIEGQQWGIYIHSR